jgi:two-component system, NarL family, invasion response regulator UvrY
MASVLVVDDHPIVLQGCRVLLQDSGFENVFEARDIASGYKLYLNHRPEVVVIDLTLCEGGLGGLLLIDLIRKHSPHVGIVAFSMHKEPSIVARALQAGANGYVVKDAFSDELIKAIKAVEMGNAYLSYELAVKVATVQNRGLSSLAELTPRELQTLSLLAEGRPYDYIARDLHISYSTTVSVSHQLKRKLGARTLPELIRTAVRLLPPAS